MVDFVLRDIRRSDLEALYALDQICFDSGIAYSKTELKQILRSASGCGVLAESSGEVAGFAAGYVSARGDGHVVTLDVSPSFRRRGLGKTLFSDLLQRFRRAGATGIRLEVEVENQPAIAFYRTFGFRPTRRVSDYYGYGRDAWEMERKL
ncbi:MAG TPA: N-acetyltransferase [Thermoanaerobaculia bacterium]